MGRETTLLRRLYVTIRKNTPLIVAFSLGAVLVSMIQASWMMHSMADMPIHWNAGSQSFLAPLEMGVNASVPPPIDRDWCPKAKCLDNLPCNPCQRRFLIILSTGRSASTTLTWMLDALPGVRMAGENNNAITHIRHMWESIVSSPFMLKARFLKAAWGHNPIPAGSVACIAQTVMETLNPPVLPVSNQEEEEKMIVGFKTIRLQRNVTTKKEIKSMANFLQTSFPCARYLVNIRSDQKALEESVKVSFPEDAESLVPQMRQEVYTLKGLSKQLGDRAFFLDSTEWTKNVSKINEVVEWLGFHPSCAFEELLEFNTGGKGKAPRGRGLQTTDSLHGREGSLGLSEGEAPLPLEAAHETKESRRARNQRFSGGRTETAISDTCRYSPR